MLCQTKRVAYIFLMLVSHVVYAENTLLPALNAQFTATKCEIPCQQSVKRDWWLMRTEGQFEGKVEGKVELRDFNKKTGQLAKTGEIWRYSQQNNNLNKNSDRMGYFYVMYEDKRAIEYLFDDLTILGIKSDAKQWQKLNQLVTLEELAQLKKVHIQSAPFHGFITETYKGKIDQAKVELIWLPALNLPVKLIYVYPKSKVTIKLNTLFSGNALLDTKNTAPKTTEETLARFQQVYYTDIGDMEQNDDAKEWLEKAHGAPGLHGHVH